MGEPGVLQGLIYEFVAELNAALAEGWNASLLPHLPRAQARTKNQLQGVRLLPLQHLILLVGHLRVIDRGAVLGDRS